MNVKDAVKIAERSGTKMGKEKLLDAIKRIQEKDIAFVKDQSSNYTMIVVKLG